MSWTIEMVGPTQALVVSAAEKRLREDAAKWRMGEDEWAVDPPHECGLVAVAQEVWRWYREAFPGADTLAVPWMEFREGILSEGGIAL